MKKETKKKLIVIITLILAILTTIFMLICILANQSWALYAEISVAIPLWVCIIIQVLIWINEEKEGKK